MLELDIANSDRLEEFRVGGHGRFRKEEVEFSVDLAF